MAALKPVRLLGITSIAFGIFDALSAERLAAQTGMRDGRAFRLAGAREIVTGLGAALFPASPAPVAARLIGDALDIVVLSGTAIRPGNDRRAAAWLGVAIVLAFAVVDAAALVSQRSAD